MYVTMVHVSVNPLYVGVFIEATSKNHQASINEKGNRRFDVLQLADDPGQFVFYEGYTNEEAAIAHKQTDHYLLWRDTVADWMAVPRIGIPYTGLFPE